MTSGPADDRRKCPAGAVGIDVYAEGDVVVDRFISEGHAAGLRVAAGGNVTMTRGLIDGRNAPGGIGMELIGLPNRTRRSVGWNWFYTNLPVPALPPNPDPPCAPDVVVLRFQMQSVGDTNFLM